MPGALQRQRLELQIARCGLFVRPERTALRAFLWAARGGEHRRSEREDEERGPRFPRKRNLLRVNTREDSGRFSSSFRPARSRRSLLGSRATWGCSIPWVSESNYVIAPIRFGGYALSLSTAQLVGLALIALLTFMNTRGLRLGKLVQNVFTTAKTGALIALIVLGIIVGLRSGAGAANFIDFWSVRGRSAGCGRKDLTAAAAFGLFVGICVAQTNSLFSADAWNNITFTAGEVKNPRRNVPLSLAFGHFPGHRSLSARERRLSRRAAFQRRFRMRRATASPLRRRTSSFPARARRSWRSRSWFRPSAAITG